MALERRFRLPRRQVPNAQRFVLGAGDAMTIAYAKPEARLF